MFSATVYEISRLVWFARNKSTVKYRRLFSSDDPTSEDTPFFDFCQASNGFRRALSSVEKADPARLPEGVRLLARNPLTSDGASASLGYDLEFEGETFRIKGNQHWKTTRDGMSRLIKAARITKKGNTARFVRFWDDNIIRPLSIYWSDTGTGGFVGDDKVYVVQTDSRVLSRCLLMTTDPGDLVLDPTCGSGTTAYVAEQWGRRWITIDTSRVALALARARIMGARYPYYLLADSRDGQIKEAEVARTAPSSQPTRSDIRQGFVYERVPHITLKSIANNAEIDVIWEQWQAKLEPLRETLNKELQKSWQEWEIPREAEAAWSAQAKRLHADWWQARIARQKEIDASIAAKAEFEYLYDRPYDDKRARARSRAIHRGKPVAAPCAGGG